MHAMRIRFWGTRGSLPKPGPSTLRYGGNSACVEVRTDDGTLIVLDCGTGAHNLGQALLASGVRPIRGHLLLTHTHWDHIQGFPFFAPLAVPGNEWDVYAPGGPGQELAAILAGQMQYTYFPVDLDQLGATIRYHDLGEGSFRIGPARITAQYLNHPGLALGYRLEIGGTAIVYATDHEPHAACPAAEQGPPGADGVPVPVHGEDRRHVRFLAGADLVIHDSQYTDAEYPAKRGWGHSTVEWSVDYALAAGATCLALFHHDPLRDDDALDQLLARCRTRAGAALDVFAAAEGQVIELAERPERAADGYGSRERPAEAMAGPVAHPGRDGRPPSVLIADDDPAILLLLETTLRDEGLRLLTAGDGEVALRIARRERPDLILIDWHMPERDGLSVCRELRADADPKLHDVPIVLITAETGPANTAAGFAAGVTDYLTKPFVPPHVRTRVRSWLMRTGVSPTGQV
jgi:CheY-like chemotaxis protein/phosphoribosyl 1,2-cyclic phosphodiesterase